MYPISISCYYCNAHNPRIIQLTENLKWKKVGTITGSVAAQGQATTSQKVIIPTEAQEVKVCVKFYRDTDHKSAVHMNKIISTYGIHVDGYYYDSNSNACFAVGYQESTKIVYLLSSWIKVVENGVAIDNKNDITADVYYR